MGTFHLLLCFCTLCFFIHFSPLNARIVNPSGVKRNIRSVSRPTPINCKMGSWSSWRPCDSCTDETFRFRYLEKPSQFSGSECFETLWDRQVCPRATSPCLEPDHCGESFTCNQTGRCISPSLRCNGEMDCGDFSDEDHCNQINYRQDKCSTLMPIPGVVAGIQGFNILTGNFMDPVLDPLYYGGMCEYVYNGEWRKFVYDAFCENLHYNEDEKNYRKPYNYHTYRFVAQAESEGSYEYYEDMVELLNARKTQSSWNAGVTVGVYYVEAGVKGGQESELLKNITTRQNQDLGYIRLLSKVQTALFKIRSNKLMLHEDFYIALMDLPEKYDFGMYSRFLNMFGTHYVTEGTMGGSLEYIVAINKTTMAKTDIEAEQAGYCIGGSLGINIPVTDSLEVGGKISGEKCEKDGSYNKGEAFSLSMIKDVYTVVHGGIIDSSAGLLAIRNPETYKKWGKSLKYNPALIEYELMPIYELVRMSTAADHVGMRINNLKMAVEEYLQQFHPCRCAPCQHNGVPMLAGSSCKCICKSGYYGVACEQTKRRDRAKIDGSWSCWGAWSTCANGRKTRTRVCNNPPPQGGGVTCLGSTSQTQRC